MKVFPWIWTMFNVIIGAVTLAMGNWTSDAWAIYHCVTAKMKLIKTQSKHSPSCLPEGTFVEKVQCKDHKIIQNIGIIDQKNGWKSGSLYNPHTLLRHWVEAFKLSIIDEKISLEQEALKIANMPIDCFSSKAFEVLRSTLQKWLLFFAYEVIGLFYLFKFVSETGQNLQFSRIIFHSRGCPNFNSPNIQITIHQIVFLLVFVVVVVFFCFFSFVKFCVK